MGMLIGFFSGNVAMGSRMFDNGDEKTTVAPCREGVRTAGSRGDIAAGEDEGDALSAGWEFTGVFAEGGEGYGGRRFD